MVFYYIYLGVFHCCQKIWNISKEQITFTVKFGVCGVLSIYSGRLSTLLFLVLYCCLCEYCFCCIYIYIYLLWYVGAPAGVTGVSKVNTLVSLVDYRVCTYIWKPTAPLLLFPYGSSWHIESSLIWLFSTRGIGSQTTGYCLVCIYMPAARTGRLR